MRTWARVVLGALTVAPALHAQIDAAQIARLEPDALGPFAPNGVMSVLVERDGRIEPLRGAPSEVGALARSHTVTWSPPRRPLLDLATGWTRSREFHEITAGRGGGVAIAIVDTGIDVNHKDFLDSAGRTRIAWLLDYSRPPAGFHPEIESARECVNELGRTCAVYSAADIDALRENEVDGDLPEDVFGHGTHVASLAASNGLSQKSNPRYLGTAPSAMLIVARVSRNATNAIEDADILEATNFAFDRADALGVPCVVNLSLGSDFGPHDGTSALERGLASHVGDEHPGHAIVVAAGNSGTLLLGSDSGYPEPLGIHAEVHVPRDSPVLVPILTPRVSSKKTQGTVFVWIALADGDDVRVGVDDGDGGWVDPVEPGDAVTLRRDGLKATVFNGAEPKNSPVPEGMRGAAVVFDGSFRPGEVLEIRLEGHATAELWVQTEGDLAATGSQALLPGATKQGTVSVPASSPDLLAVGATINRTEWTTHYGRGVSIDSLEPDGLPVFSGAGPNARGLMKPDLVAPGAFLVGALSSRADPRDGFGGLFDGAGICTDNRQCLVADRDHAITSGTSMAAPIVSGAIALLFERDPTLTQRECTALLQAGARRPAGSVPLEQQLGPGALDLLGVLDVLLFEGTREPKASESWLSASASFLRPSAAHPVHFVAQLRAAVGVVAGGFDGARLRLEVDGAQVASPLEAAEPGLWRFSIAASDGSGGGRRARVRLRFDGALLAERELPIGVDQVTAERGVIATGGCAASGRAPRGRALAGFVSALAASFLALTTWRGGARTRGARTARRRDRTGARA